MRQDFRRLIVWRRAKALALRVYEVTADGALSRDWALRDQMRRSAISVPSNIAEGNERGSNKDCSRFLHIAKGSIAELLTQIEIAMDLGMVPKESADEMIDECCQIANMLGGLITYHHSSEPGAQIPDL